MSKSKKTMKAVILFVSLLVGLISNSFSQEKKVAPTSKALYQEISQMDSVMFNAFNNQDFKTFKNLFTQDLEWFQDNDGLVPFKTVFKNFENTFKKEYKLTRELVKGSLEVYPLKNYGAIEIGEHKFRHIENGKEEIGTFKFVMIWKHENNQWKISRVISFGH